MNSSILRSVGAVFAGLLFIALTHSSVDFVLERAGVLPSGHLNVSSTLILFVIFYRGLFSYLGCYLTARLAPSKPMKHAVILGGIGTLLSVVGAIVTANMNIAPVWYSWVLVCMALPIAWLAGKSSLRNRNLKMKEI